MKRKIVIATALALVAALVVLAPQGAAASSEPCTVASGGAFHCDWAPCGDVGVLCHPCEESGLVSHPGERWCGVYVSPNVVRPEVCLVEF